ncbi:MAG TPA: TetR/AcrR family transcriptional regulator C-terminal domain-containing protein [Candidatus Limnocylindrales bacterium]|jgi:TetR/AcrR family tetracycline transcriptional repressor
MPEPLSRLQRLAAAAKAKAAEQRAELERKAAAGDPRAMAALSHLNSREESIRDRIDRSHSVHRERQAQLQERLARRQAGQHRRGGGRRARYEPADVVAAALALLDERGIDGVTLRDVASRLHVQAPALYWHFAGKSDIVDGMAHTMLSGFVSGLEPPADPNEWKPWLRQTAHGMRDAMLAHRDGARIVAGAGLGRARSLAELLEKTLVVLERAGFDPVTASAGTRTVISYAFGAVIEEQSPPPEDVPEPQIKEFLKDYPSIARSIDAQLRLSPAAQFDMGLELIIRGLEARR